MNIKHAVAATLESPVMRTDVERMCFGPKSSRLETRVLERLEAGLALTRYQRIHLHLQTAWKSQAKWNVRRALFHIRGILRALCERNSHR